MKYAIIVHGRFFAFDLVRALLLRNRDVLLLTNYPKWAVRRFGIHPEYLESFWPHGIVCRFLLCLNRWLKIPFPESLAHRIFGMWAANRLRDSDADVFYCFSGVAEELFAQSRKTRKVRLLARCSAHIRAQRKILVREASLRDVDIAVPSSWMTEREIKEYAMSDGVVVLSQFAQNSFIEYGHSEKGLHLLLLGADLLQFWPSSAVIEARCRRILAGLPLRILYVGTLSHRKGAAYLAEITQALESKNFDFTIVGPVERDARPLLASLRSRVRLVAKQPQSSLHRWYAQADIFIFPTLA